MFGVDEVRARKYHEPMLRGLVLDSSEVYGRHNGEMNQG